MKHIIFFFLILLVGCQPSEMESPSKKLTAHFFLNKKNVLRFTVLYDKKIICDTSSLGVELNNIKTYEDVTIKLEKSHQINESYSVKGVHKIGYNYCKEYFWTVTHQPNNYKYTIQARCYNDAFAYRIILPGKGKRVVNNEVASWKLPINSKVWFGERNSSLKLASYAGEWTSVPASELATISQQGPIQTMPLIYETKDGLYLMITEAALYEYSGMRLRATTNGGIHADFTEKKGFELTDTISTPWRILGITENLNQLVNTDIITNLSPSPDSQLFGDKSWIHSGRSLWSWWSGIDGQYMTEQGEKAVINLAQKMGYEYVTLDEGWEKWENKWQMLKETSQYASERGIDLFVWRHSKKLNNPQNNYEQMRYYMDSIVSCGVKGLKIDFINGESLDKIRFMTNVLKNAAQRHLLVNFHGCPKPTGENYTYPNEITREAIRGLELNRISQMHLNRLKKQGKETTKIQYKPGNERQFLPATHNCALPFTRGLLGSADYTPIAFSMPGDLLPIHQLACAYLINSQLLTMAENPFYIYREPSLSATIPYIKSIPNQWDKTIVLPQSKIGEIAAFARQNKNTWYLAIICSSNQQINVPFDFLNPNNNYKMTLIKDSENGQITERVQTISSHNNINEIVVKNGGLVAKFTPMEENN